MVPNGVWVTQLSLAAKEAQTPLSSAKRLHFPLSSAEEIQQENETTSVVSKYNQGRIAIGGQYDRWMELKETLQLKTHADVAEYLLDRNETLAFESSPKRVKTASSAVTSTPGPTATILPPKFSDVSEISSDLDKGDRNSDLSGVEQFVKTDKKTTAPSSFLNPLDLSICLSENYTKEDSEDSSDEDYEPSYIMTMREDTQTEAMVEDSENEDSCDEESNDDLRPGIAKILTPEEIEGCKEDRPFLVYLSQLHTLAEVRVLPNCQLKGCKKPVHLEKAVVGSALYFKWNCSDGHQAQQWCSQPVLNRGMHLGDLTLSSSILLSGSNFQKVSMMAKFMKLPIVSKNSFYKMQRTYLIPAVDEFWTEHQETVFNQFQGRAITILGDGRMDSPGHTAQYCSYTFMEYDTKTILHIITMDKRVTEKKSTNLEKACFVQGLRYLLDKGLHIVEVVTDAHVQVASVMSKFKQNNQYILL
ncbi:uncharacterized protein LOC134262243 [Saccostrea cucullata]|uniref:uncharacterized protein LOC134262243 n=1 Tax=Saccostrea cuccullata TaxID=36930 RepID=UPI002ED03006